jgi:hypothetical protein
MVDDCGIGIDVAAVMSFLIGHLADATEVALGSFAYHQTMKD